MARALISVSTDGFTYLSLNGATSRYSDTGQALSYLGDYARETATPVPVTIDEAGRTVEVLVDETGRVAPAPADSPTPDRATAEASDSAAAPASRTVTQTRTRPATDRADVPEDTSTSARVDPAPRSGPQSLVTADSAEAGSGGEDYPQGTPFSGPVAVTAPAPQRSRRQKRTERSRRPLRLKKITVPGLVLIGLAILMIGAFVIPNIVPSQSAEAPQSISTDEQINPGSDITVTDTDDVVPSFESTPKWEAKVPGSASVTASDRGVLVVDDEKLEVLDPETGDVRYSGRVSQPPTFAVDTLIDGRPALLWQVGNSAEALFDGESTPTNYRLPDNARISSAGTSVLVKSGNWLSTFGTDGLIDIPVPETGMTPMAVENDELFSADYDGPVRATNIRTGDERDISLEVPADDLQIIKWISAGHGKVITLWGEQGASTNSGHRIQLVVHSLEDGAILSTVTTTTDMVGEMSWVRGQGGERAYIGPYLFDMRSGLLLMDTSRKDIHLSEPRGTIVPCTIGTDASCLLAGNNAYRTYARLLALTDAGSSAIVDGPDSTIRAYEKKTNAPGE
ncbi:hypothetical protein DFO66_101253 [Brevibacterium sanguinis]|uniref:Uncharacterized protein n=2 Tax=Brevibacterium TaxID=1696 RepID=A0A366INB3_9MICO|nr:MULTISPECIES: hypothetical protein [Brevibacterium]RBP68028.1 hypothetical protein DFO66_101253 [Brevibacterium sanguinis]RBP74555.1 hypothetical protein DFO65_101276 [Brevibacterium celere]